MNNNEYIENVLKTEATSKLSINMEPIKQRLQDTSNVRLLHAFLGLETETAELQDAFKKHIFYGKPLDRVNLVEEAGDLFWYLGILCHELGVSFEEVMEKNINKLRVRFGDKFTEGAADVRNLEEERKVLEK